MSNKWIRREQKRNSQKSRMPKHGMSVLTIEIIVQKKARKAETIRRQQRRANKNAPKIQTD